MKKNPIYPIILIIILVALIFLSWQNKRLSVHKPMVATPPPRLKDSPTPMPIATPTPTATDSAAATEKTATMSGSDKDFFEL